MESINISLPEELQNFVLEQVQAGYVNSSEYIGELIRADRARKRQELFEQELLEGLANDSGRVLSDADWTAIREGVKTRHAGKLGTP